MKIFFSLINCCVFLSFFGAERDVSTPLTLKLIGDSSLKYSQAKIDKIRKKLYGTVELTVESLGALRQSGTTTLNKKPFIKLVDMLTLIKNGRAREDADSAISICDRILKKIFLGHTLHPNYVPAKYMALIKEKLIGRMRFMAPFRDIPITSRYISLPISYDKTATCTHLLAVSNDLQYAAIQTCSRPEYLIQLFNLHSKEHFDLPCEQRITNILLPCDNSLCVMTDNSKIIVVDVTDNFKVKSIKLNDWNGKINSLTLSSDNKTIKISTGNNTQLVDVASGMLMPHIHPIGWLSNNTMKSTDRRHYTAKSKDKDELELFFDVPLYGRMDEMETIQGCADTYGCRIRNKTVHATLTQKIPFYKIGLAGYTNGKFIAFLPKNQLLQVTNIEFTEEQIRFLKTIPFEVLNTICTITKNKKKIGQKKLSRCIKTIQDLKFTQTEKSAQELLPWMLAHLKKAQVS